jgi:protein-S-isoprenylcysteine O-methyltransferase Ste14
MILLYAIAIGLMVGLVTGGRVSALAGQRVRWWPIALGGLFFQLVLFSPAVADVIGDAGPALYVGSTGLVLVALAANIRLPGFWLIGLGAVLNLTAIVANGGYMPASPEAVAALSGVAVLPT